MKTIGNADEGSEVNFAVVRGSDYTFGVQIKDNTQALIDASSLIAWVESGTNPFTIVKMSTGTFQVTLQRAATDRLAPATQYSIGYVDVDTGHKPLLFGVIFVAPAPRLGP